MSIPPPLPSAQKGFPSSQQGFTPPPLSHYPSHNNINKDDDYPKDGTVNALSSTEWAELLQRYRLVQEEVLWPFFELTERVRATQMKAMRTSDLIKEGIQPNLSSSSPSCSSYSSSPFF